MVRGRERGGGKELTSLPVAAWSTTTTRSFKGVGGRVYIVARLHKQCQVERRYCVCVWVAECMVTYFGVKTLLC